MHAYLARLPEGWLLVDGGADTPAGWAALDAGVRKVAEDWRAITVYVVTHMHLDHMGLAARARAASGAPLAMGRLDAERAAGAAADVEGEAAYRAAVLLEAGAPEHLQPWAEPGRPRDAPPRVQQALDGDGGMLRGAPGWRWLWTPGHTAGHVSLLRESDRVLLAGDVLLPRISPTLGVNRQRRDPVGDFLAALKRLEAATPRVAFGGHGGPIADPPARVVELRDATRAENDAVLAIIDGEAHTAWEVAAARYVGRELPVSAELQALRETLAHLHHMERRGAVVREGAGPARFAAAR